MSFQRGLICFLCGEPSLNEWTFESCSTCGGSIIVDYHYELIRNEINREKLSKRPVGVWKYIELLPISDRSNIISLGEGGTYLHRAKRIADRIGLRRLFIKDETTNPTGSFVDRGVTIELSRAKQLGYMSTVCGTAGNLGASLAAYSAKAGFKCKIFLPRRIDVGKFYQIIAYGAEVEPTRDYEEALSKAATLRNDFYMVFPGDPFFLEGLKTTGYEICEQIGWKPPRNIVVPMGDGGHISMIWRGINEMIRVGLLDETKPRMIGVQAHGAAPIVKAFQKKRLVVKQLQKSDTLAMDIGVKKPLHGNLAVQAIFQSGGRAIAVPDKEMLYAASLLAKTEGIFAEPASASTIASLLRLVEDGDIDRDEETVCVLTGTGLKDPSSTRKFIEGRKRVERFLERIGERMVTTGLTGTKLSILKVLSENRSYGYELRKKLKNQFDLDLSLPSVYQHINELETMKLVEKVHITRKLGKRERQYYTLTEKGRVVLKGSVTTR